MEYKDAHASQPVKYQLNDFPTVAIKTEKIDGFNNEIEADPSRVSNTSDATLPKKQSSVSDEQNCSLNCKTDPEINVKLENRDKQGNSGCMSMYVNRHVGHVCSTSNPTLPRQQSGFADEGITYLKYCEPGQEIYVKLEHTDEREENQSSRVVSVKQSNFVENSSGINYIDRCKNTYRDKKHQDFPQKLFNISEIIEDVQEGTSFRVVSGDYQDVYFSDDNDSASGDDAGKVRMNDYDSSDDDGADDGDDTVGSHDVESDVGSNDYSRCDNDKEVDTCTNIDADKKNEDQESNIIYILDEKEVFSHSRPDVGVFQRDDEIQHMVKDNLTKKSLEVSFRKDATKKSFECFYCKKMFAHKSVLAEHIRMHTKEKPFECSYCSKKFGKKSHLKTHNKIHTGEKPFQCSVCKKTFRQNSNLKTHLLIHSDEKTFECYICKSKFRYRSHLNRHVRIHTGEKPFECSVCQKPFIEKSALTKHIKIHTGGNKPFECSICKKKFSTKSYLSKHNVRTHK